MGSGTLKLAEVCLDYHKLKFLQLSTLKNCWLNMNTIIIHWHQAQFALVVDNFNVKYINDDDVQHIITSLALHDPLTGKTMSGISLTWWKMIHQTHFRLGIYKSWGSWINARICWESSQMLQAQKPTKPNTNHILMPLSTVELKYNMSTQKTLHLLLILKVVRN